jgi:hypothetical protein
VIFQSVKTPSPQPAIRREPGVKLNQRLGPDAIEATLRVGAHLDQTSLLQHPEMLRDCRLTEAKLVNELPHRSLPIPENTQNRLPIRLAQHPKRDQRDHSTNMP